MQFMTTDQKAYSTNSTGPYQGTANCYLTNGTERNFLICSIY